MDLKKITRRDFIKSAGVAGGAVALSGTLSYSGLTADDQVTISLFLPNVGEWYENKWYGVKKQCEEFGWKAFRYNAGSYANISKQISQVEPAIERGDDGIIIHATSSSALAPVLERAMEQGTKVLLQHVPVEGLGAPLIWEAPYYTAYMEAETLVEKMEGKGKIIANPGPPGQHEAMKMWEGVQDYINYFPEVEIADFKWHSDISIAGAQTVIENMLTAHPDTKGIYTWYAQTAPGAVYALQARGYEPGEVKIATGYGIDPDSEKLLREGWIQGYMVSLPVEVGMESVKLMKEMLEGKQIPKESNVPPIQIYKETVDLWDRSGAIPE